MKIRIMLLLIMSFVAPNHGDWFPAKKMTIRTNLLDQYVPGDIGACVFLTVESGCYGYLKPGTGYLELGHFTSINKNNAFPFRLQNLFSRKEKGIQFVTD